MKEAITQHPFIKNLEANQSIPVPFLGLLFVFTGLKVALMHIWPIAE